MSTALPRFTTFNFLFILSAGIFIRLQDSCYVPCTAWMVVTPTVKSAVQHASAPRVRRLEVFATW